jgi:isoamylase
MVEALRKRQVKKKFLCAGAVIGRHADAAHGDEVRRTQRGNNNGYCQDTDILVRLGPSRRLLDLAGGSGI